MSTVEFPYRERKYGAIALSFAFGLIGILNMQKFGAIGLALGGLTLSFALLLLWLTVMAPSTVSFDTSSGVATFLPHHRLSPSIYDPIPIRDYSSIYRVLAGRRDTYSVEVINHRGESRRLLFKVPEADAEKMCAFVSKEFGLNNRGLMG